MKKYSANFERDYYFYLRNLEHFTFSGKYLDYEGVYDEKGMTHKEAFFILESEGKSYKDIIKNKKPDGGTLYGIKTCSPDILDRLLLCKAAVNFQIKQWAEGRNDATLSFRELLQIQEEFGCPDWVVEAVENQRWK